ncbi:MAG: hypothetical protein PWQ09_1270 [Candidatus Cloacimonadota bacterium]|jgi:hypothetical protein|nr:hypothetical protein [Candidatus Cloacimonadota bacterium]
MKKLSLKATLSILTMILVISSLLMASEVDEKEIIAEYDGGTITKDMLNERLEKIPSFYRQRYETNEGKQKLLDNLCTEAIFFAEATQRGLADDPEVKKRVKWEKTKFLFQRYKKDLMDKKMQFSKDEMLEYYKEHEKMYATQTLEEAAPDIQRRLRDQNRQKIENEVSESLEDKYNVQINYSVIDSTALANLQQPQKLKNVSLINSNVKDLKYSLPEFVETYSLVDPNRFQRLDSVKALRDYVDTIVEMKLYYWEALEKGFPTAANLDDELAQIEKTTILRTMYNRLVIEEIDLSDEAVKQYYEENIEEFSSLPNRTIQAFVFKKKPTAQKVYKEVKKALGYGFLGIRTGNVDTLAINKIIEEKTEFTTNNGVIDNIYANDIIPGYGKDKVYNAKIWEIPSKEAAPHKLSEIFQNSKGQYVFFRILEDNQAVPQPFEEIQTKVKRTMLRNLAIQKFEAKQKELALKYNLQKYPDRLIVKLEPEQYFKKAEDSQKRNNFQQAIYFYDQIIKYYPETTDAYKARFMKGFVCAEDLNQKGEALEIFQNLVEDYPDGELNESAEYMIQELEGKNNVIEKIKEENK